MQYAVPAVGMKPVYTNTSIDFGTADVGPLALGIKIEDGAYYAMDLSTKPRSHRRCNRTASRD